MGTAGYDPTEREWYKAGIAANGQIVRTPPYVDITNNMVTSNLRSLTDSTGKVIGVIGIDVEQTFISNMLSDIKIGESGYFMLVHNTGVIMSDGYTP